MSNYPDKIEEVSTQSISLVPDPSSKWYHPFNFLAQEYGNNLKKILSRTNGILALGQNHRFSNSVGNSNSDAPQLAKDSSQY